MALCKRLIARLDIKGNRLIKGIRFEGLRVVGDPCEAAVRYYKEGADELIYIDAVASLYGRNGLEDVLRRTSREVFIPITAGGGVRSVADASALLAAGADKIAVNTAALQRPELITELAEAFGSQCVVASIQARRIGPEQWEAMAEAGRERSGWDVIDWIEQVQKFRAGELLITSVDQDGTCSGPDMQLQEAVSAIARIPLVFGGGFVEINQLELALQKPAIAGVSIAAALHNGRLDLTSLKLALSTAVVPLAVRSVPGGAQTPMVSVLQPLTGQRIGVIDYGMGNQQSLINALEHLGATVLLASEPKLLQRCDLLTLPGVGSFPQGMLQLQERGLDSWLKQWVAAGNPLLGICLGMQMLFESSEEFTFTNGLGLMKGGVIAMPIMDERGNLLTLPHIGWNCLIPGEAWNHEEISDPSNQYFVHSYMATSVNPNAVLFNCLYGHHKFVAAVRQGRIAGFQFHPELSGSEGLYLLQKVILSLINQQYIYKN